MNASSGFDVMAFLPLILIFAVFYFLLIRPQQKKLKAHQDMLANIRRGDKVVTNGGIIGTVVKLTNDRELQVEISENVRVRVLRSMIAEILAKTEPANGEQTELATPPKQPRQKKTANAEPKE
jgi:preprotein translocase subunit YajC